MKQQPPLHPELEALLAKAHAMHFTKGEVVLRPDSDANDVFYLQAGLVKAYVIGNNGEEHIHVLFRPGDFFPLVRIVTGLRLNIYFAAVTDCTVRRLPGEKFTQSLQTNPTISFEIMKLMANQYATYIARVDNLEYKFARERLAYRLLLLARKIGVRSRDGIVLPHLSQYEIGSTINLSRESVSRELSRFERLGYIGHEAQGIVLKDLSALRHELGTHNQTLFLDE